jgi:hypothetical protein
LALLAALMAFDGCVDAHKPLRERRGWCAVGAVLLMFSFEEVASLHDYLGRRHGALLLLLGALAFACASYGLAELRRSALNPRKLALLVLGFAALGLAPLLEDLSVLPGHRLAYGALTVLEEGTEIAALLAFLAAARGNSESLCRMGLAPFAAPSSGRRSIVVAALALWPFLTAATLVLTSRTGAADWLAAALSFSCALLVVREALRRGSSDAHDKARVLFYLGASAAANAVRIAWVPEVLGLHVSVRGTLLAFLVLAAAALQRSARRSSVARVSSIAGAIAVSAIVLPWSQLLWAALPPLLALWLFSLETAASPETADRVRTG